MTLEESKEELKQLKEDLHGNGFVYGDFDKVIAIDTVLNYIENESIPKEKVREKMNSYDDIICYAGTEEGMAELKQEEYDEAFYGNKALQELLGE